MGQKILVTRNIAALAFLYLHLKCLSGEQMWDRSFSAQRVPSTSVPTGSFTQEIQCPSKITAMASCSENPDCSSFDYDAVRNSSKQYKAHGNAGLYRVQGRECPTNRGYEYNEALKLCYWVNKEKAVWEEARRACQSRGEDLIALDTMEKFEYVRELFRSTKRVNVAYWLGAHRVGNTWKWVSGVTLPLSHKYWYKGQPDRVKGNERHVTTSGHYFRNFGLDDGYADKKAFSICQLSLT